MEKVVDEIQKLSNDYFTINDEFAKRLVRETNPVEREILLQRVKDFHKINKFLDELMIEMRYLTLMNKATSSKLCKLRARIEINMKPFRDLLPQEETQSLYERLFPTPFDKFVHQRVRQLGQGYPEVVGEKVSIRDLYKSYKRWFDITIPKPIPRLALEEFKELCEKRFGSSQGKYIYENMRVFLEEEDVEEFDVLHNQKEEK